MSDDLIAEAISGIFGDRPTDTEEPRTRCHDAWAQYDKLRAENDRLRDLFKKYINHVSAEEGSTFMPYKYDGFSDEEMAALNALDAEAALAKEAGE